MRRGRAALAAACLLAVVSWGCRRGPEPPARPNVLLVTIDTLRADHTSAYGYGRPTTPVLAALAREGVRVEQAYAPTATTGPSHATLFTSLYPLSHGLQQNGQFLDDRWTTLAERFRDAGWATGAVVSSVVLEGRFGYGQGFGSFGLSEVGKAGATTDLALEWLASAKPSAPWFLWVHYYDPHAPYSAPAPDTDRWVEPGFDKRQAEIARYDAEVAFADKHLGRLLAGVDPARTLVAVTADHGEGLWQHDYKGHGIHLYEEAVRIPLVFRWPDHLPAGVVMPGPVELVDLAPTLLELTGTAWSGERPQGLSLAPGLRGERRVAGWDGRRPVFLQRRSYDAATKKDGDVAIAGTKLGMRQGSFKYIEARQEGTRELYDLATDPTEQTNLLSRNEPEAGRLALLLERWRAHHDRGIVAREDRSPETEEALRALGYVR